MESERIMIEPKFGRVLIRREVKKKISSIIIPDESQKNHSKCEGVIVALGETAGWAETYDGNGDRVPVQTLKIGDKVIFGRHSGAWLDATYDGKSKSENDDGTLFICQDADVLAVVNDGAKV